MRALLAWLLLCLPVVADDLVVVTMPLCQPCRKLKGDLLRHPEMTRGHAIRLLEGKRAMAEWQVTSVPTLIRVRDGREVARHVGYSKKEDLQAWLDD